jgi:hypothetical protein
MPTVPRYERPQVSTRPVATPYSGARVTGHDVVGGIQEGLNLAGQVYQREKAKQDQARLQGAYAELSAWQHKRIHDPKEGALTRRGEAALGLSDALLKDFDSEAERIATGLADDGQRQAFARIRQEQRENVAGTLAKHERGQFEVVAQEKYSAALGAAASNAANSYADPKAWTQARDMGEGAIRLRAETQGWSAEQRDAELRTFRTQLHLNSLDRMVAAKDVTRARAYLEEHGAEIDGTARARTNIDKVVAQLGVDEDAELRAAAIIETARTEKTGWVDEAQAIALIDGVPAGPARDEVRERVRVRLGDATRLRNQEVESRFERAFSAFVKSGTLSQISAEDRAWLQDRAPGKWRELQQMARQDADRARSRTAETPEQREAFLQLRIDMASNPERYREMTSQQFISEWGPLLSPSGLKSAGVAVAHEQQQARIASEKGALVDDPEFKDAVLARAAEAEITNKDQVGRLFLHMQSWLADWRSKNGDKRPPRSEVDAAIGDALLEGYRRRDWWFDSKTRKYQVPAGEIDRFEPTAPGEASQVAPAAPRKAVVIGPNGQRGQADVEGLDAWLSAHPEWRRQ